MLNGKATKVLLAVGLIKKTINRWIFSWTENFRRKSDFSNWRKIRFEGRLDLSNYATKTDLKSATGVDTSSFAKKDDSAKKI